MTTKLLTVEDEPEKYTIKVDAAKRTGKTKELKPNTIDTNLYCENTKTCGFTSIMPVEWLRLFEKAYNDHEDLKCEWNRLLNNEGQYSEVQLSIFNLETVKCLVIHVYLTTGVILIKGQLWDLWATVEFGAFNKMFLKEGKDIELPSRDFLDGLLAAQAGFGGKKKPRPSNNKKDELESKDLDEAPNIVSDDKVKANSNESSKPKDGDSIKDLEFINLENTRLKESIAILDKGLTGVVKGFDAIKEALKDQEKRISIQLSQLERKFDDKLEVYNEELRQEFKRDIVSTRNSMKDKLNVAEETLKKRITTLEEQNSGDNTELIDQQIRKMVNITGVNEMIKSIENRVKDIENHLSKDDVEYQTFNQSSTIETLQKKVQNQSEQLATQANTIQILQEKVRKMEMVKNDNNDKTNQFMRNRIMESPQGAEAHNPKENTLQAPDKSQNTSSQSSNNNVKRINKVSNSLLVLMDSNRQHIEKDRLWHDCEIVKCNRIQEATKIISKITEAPKALLVHAGVNDIEHQSPQEVFNEILTLIDTQKHALPHTHLILSEIIPRMDALDRDVLQINEMIREIHDEKITIVKHHSLRYYEHYRDNKHVNESTGITKLAGNLKAAIRSAFGIAQFSKPRMSTQWATNSNPKPSQWYNDSVVPNAYGSPRPFIQRGTSISMPSQSAENGDQSLKTISKQLEMLIPLMCGRIQMPVAPVAPSLLNQQVR